MNWIAGWSKVENQDSMEIRSMDYFRVENQDGNEIEIQSPVFGYYVSGDKKMFVLSDHPSDELGMSYVFQAYIANPSDHDWNKNLYLIWFGSHAATNFLVWAKGFEDALEEAAQAALDAGMKGFFVDDEQMREYYEEAREDLGPDADEEEVQQQAEADLTYTESGYIPSYEWGGQDVHHGQAFGDGQDLYAAAKFVCEAYTDDSGEERFELVPNRHRRNSERKPPGRYSYSSSYDDYLVSLPRNDKFYLYSYNVDDNAWGPMIGKARGYATIREAFDDAQAHAFQRGAQSRVVVREDFGGATQIGHVGEAHPGGNYQPNSRGGSVDEHAARELELYIENDYALVGAPNSQGKSIEKNLERKIKQGKFDYALSIKLWGYLMETGAKKYAQEHGEGRDWHEIFSPATRRYVAERFARSFAQERGLRVA